LARSPPRPRPALPHPGSRRTGDPGPRRGRRPRPGRAATGLHPGPDPDRPRIPQRDPRRAEPKPEQLRHEGRYDRLTGRVGAFLPRRWETEMESGAQQEVPAPAAMMGLITGYWVSQAIGVVALLGVADELAAGPRDSDDLARAVGAEPRSLYRVLRLLASLGLFTENATGAFGLTALGDTLRSDSPGSVRNFAVTETAPGHWLPWGRLHESVRTGRPMAREALGMELFEWYSKNPDEAGYFSAAMGNLSALAAGELVRVYDFSGVRTVADIGGAHGVLLPAVLQANPGARGILFDLPHVVATAG